MRTDGEMNEQAKKEKRACYRMTTRDWNCPSGKRYDSTSHLKGTTDVGRAESILFRWNKTYSEPIDYNENKILHFLLISNTQQSIISNETILRGFLNKQKIFTFFIQKWTMIINNSLMNNFCSYLFNVKKIKWAPLICELGNKRH